MRCRRRRTRGKLKECGATACVAGGTKRNFEAPQRHNKATQSVVADVTVFPRTAKYTFVEFGQKCIDAGSAHKKENKIHKCWQHGAAGAKSRWKCAKVGQKMGNGAEGVGLFIFDTPPEKADFGGSANVHSTPRPHPGGRLTSTPIPHLPGW
eukprot:gene10383-biopygen9336